jgi:hypothetical protein
MFGNTQSVPSQKPNGNVRFITPNADNAYVALAQFKTLNGSVMLSPGTWLAFSMIVVVTVVVYGYGTGLVTVVV